MVKALVVDPKEVRKPSKLKLGTIPVNQYDRTVADELREKRIDVETARNVWRDMSLIREFESMLDSIKRLGAYGEVKYDHKGPAHLSIGQEPAAVGEALGLSVDDHIYGSHRSHGEIIAKGMAAIRELDAGRLQAVMREYHGGQILGVIEAHRPASDPKELAVEYLLYGLLAEIWGRDAGFQRGMGGSMHAFFTPFGVYPNNAIVGGSGDIAAGAALHKKVARAPGIVVANIGDASAGCGPVWEALNFSAMGQFYRLWSEAYRGGLPIIFAFMDNFYGMGGQTHGETMGFEQLSRIGAGVNPFNMHAETVDGNRPLAVAEAIRRKKELIAKGEGPILLDILTYRQSGHSPSDASAYRSREEIDLWREADALVEFAEELIAAGAATQAELDAWKAWSQEKVAKACALAADLKISPRIDLVRHPEAIERMMFCVLPRTEPLPPQEGDVLKPLAENTRWIAVSKKKRSGLEGGKMLPESKAVSLRDALFEAVIREMYRDRRIIAYGEENRDWDGAFGVYRGMTESFPYNRFFNAPISEGAIVGTAVGCALEGGRALVEIMYADFLGRAGDEVFNQLSKWQAMSAGDLRMPVVLRISVGAKYGAQHSQDWTALAAHIPGLKVIFPATPYDAKGLLTAALRGDDPVLCFESQQIYGVTEIFHPEGVPAEEYEVPIGVPEVKRPGKDLTILTFGGTLYRALQAAETLRATYGIEAELIDGRSLVPFDYAPVIESVRKTGRIVLASDACQRGSHIETIAANLGQLAFDLLDAPIAVVGARNWITPPAEMEESFFPQPSWILSAIHHHIQALPGWEAEVERSPRWLDGISKGGV
ncbi:MAG: dehydrogenase [Planctomycetes bacterium]|nr:dehydrogenase [Planctomycetota bacterium]